MTSELTQIVNLIKSKYEKVENICYKEVHRIKLGKRDSNNPIVFNTKSILTNLIWIKSNLEAYLELKKRSEFFDEFVVDYNRFLNNYNIYSFPINRYSRKDKSTKYINITGVGVDEDDSKATLVWRQMSNINLKINNNSLEIRKTY